jgi:hypothetical protein
MKKKQKLFKITYNFTGNPKPYYYLYKCNNAKEAIDYVKQNNQSTTIIEVEDIHSFRDAQRNVLMIAGGCIFLVFIILPIFLLYLL